MKYALLFLILIVSCETVPPIKYVDGGYDYPKTILAKDSGFYYYPLKDVESRRDSFDDALKDNFLKLFNEPNLSLKPADKDIFRFVYTGFKMIPVIILLTDGKVIIKKGVNMGNYGPEKDEKRLSTIEHLHLYLEDMNFPFNKPTLKPWKKKYLDSMIKQYPQLLDTKYYRYLVEKSIIPQNEVHSSFTEKNISFSKKEFNELVNTINASGFWKSPYRIICKSPDTDGYEFSLEANTKGKYNFVKSEGCPNDTTKFTKACQKLLEYAELGERYNLISVEKALMDTLK